MKSIKPVNADSGRTKRKSSRRKPAQGKVAPAPTALDPAPFAWPSVPPPLNIVQVQPGLPDQQAAPPPSEHGHPSPHAPAYPQASQPVEQMPSSPSSSRRSIKVEHPRPTREFSSHSPQPTQPSIHPPEFQIPVVEQPPPRASTSASAPPRAPEASEVPTASASDSNASNASSPVGSPSPSMDGSEPPNKRRRVQPKPRFSHPLPACKTCQRTNVQLLHGGRKWLWLSYQIFSDKTGHRVLPYVYRRTPATAATSAAASTPISSLCFLLPALPSCVCGTPDHIQLLGTTAPTSTALISCAIICISL